MIMGDSSTSYIRMVQHLIEKCLLFNMNKEECVEALAEHANIKSVITSTGPSLAGAQSGRFGVFGSGSACIVVVWTELEKENREFFQAYTRGSVERAMEMETRQRIQKMAEPEARAPDDQDN